MSRPYVRGTTRFGEKTREVTVRWYDGHLRRQDDGYIGRRMVRMELPGKRKRGRPERRFMKWLFVHKHFKRRSWETS